MKKNADILIIGRDFHPDGKETAAHIAGELRPYLNKRELNAHLVLLRDVLFDIANGAVKVFDAKTGRDLASYRAVLMTNWFSHASIRKDIAHALALYFQFKGVSFMNTEALHTRSTSKLSQMTSAALQDVPIPRTVFSLSLDHLQHYLRQEKFPMPFVFKDAQASRGQANFVLQSVSEIDQHRKAHTERTPFMAQAFIKSDHSDFRFFVVNGQTKLAMQRIGSADSHLHNTSAGASTRIVPLQKIAPEVLAYVSKMSSILHRELTGIDIMFDKTTQQPYFLEANPVPQIASGSNVDLKLEALAEALESIARGAKS